MNSRLVFVCGALRSGTSMTHLMLNAHPQLRNPGEFDFFFDLRAAAGKEPSAEEFREYLSRDRIFKSKNLGFESAASSYKDMLRGFVSQLDSEDSLLCLNLHRNFEFAYEYFPEATFIHVVRDPRDVSRSSIGMGWAGSPFFGVDHWIDTEKSWHDLSPKLSEKQKATLRYEDLVSSPDAELRGICDLLGIEFDASMLNYDDHSSYAKPDPSLINQWKTKLTSRQIELVESKAAKLMKLNGYSCVFDKPRAPASLEKIRLSIQNFFFRHNFAVKRYGFFLHFAVLVNDRLAIDTDFSRKLVERKHAIRKALLK